MDYLHLGHAGKLGMLFRTAAYQAVDDREIAFPVTYAGCTRDGRHIVIDGQRTIRLRGFLAYDYDDPHQQAPVAHEWRTVAGQEYVVVTLPLAMDAWSKPVLDPTLEVQPGAAQGKDCHLNSVSQDTNYNITALYLHRDYYRGLIQFDLSSIPANATVTAATLTVYVTNSGHTVQAFRILPANDWVEDEATWNSRKTGTSWAGSAGCGTAGTDYDATYAFSLAPGAAGSYQDWALDANGIADVQGWVAGTFVNYGLRLYVTGTNDVRFYSSDHSTASERPKLTVEYTLPAAASEGPPLLRRQRH
jgi:hypothetical protein